MIIYQLRHIKTGAWLSLLICRSAPRHRTDVFATPPRLLQLHVHMRLIPKNQNGSQSDARQLLARLFNTSSPVLIIILYVSDLI